MIHSTLSKVAFFILCCGTSCAQANIRAPISVDQQSSSTLAAPQQAKGLTVKAERLSFDMGAPYSGDTPVHSQEVLQADIQAEYEIEAQEGGDFAFAFIAADQAPASVQINEEAVVAQAPVEDDRYAMSMANPQNPKQWKIAFKGHLHQGANTIKIQYRQPLGKQEIRHGYFITSRWESVAPYESGPLHEWQLAEDFHLDITITAQEDSNLVSRFIWGPRFEANLQRGTSIRYESATIESPTANTRYQDGRLYYTISLGRDFPDRIFAVIQEVR